MELVSTCIHYADTTHIPMMMWCESLSIEKKVSSFLSNLPLVGATVSCRPALVLHSGIGDGSSGSLSTQLPQQHTINNRPHHITHSVLRCLLKLLYIFLYLFLEKSHAINKANNPLTPTWMLQVNFVHHWIHHHHHQQQWCNNILFILVAFRLCASLSISPFSFLAFCLPCLFQLNAQKTFTTNGRLNVYFLFPPLLLLSC